MQDIDEIDAEEQEHPLRPICSMWRKVLRRAIDYKNDLFTEYAEEGMKYFVGDTKEIWSKYQTGARKGRDGVPDAPPPEVGIQVVLAKVSELVELYGPTVYDRNPFRMATPRQFQIPPIQMVATVLDLQPNDPRTQQIYQQLANPQSKRMTTAQLRAQLMQAYLNYTPNELDLKRHSRRAIDEAFIKGMGVLWTEVYSPSHADVKMVGSFYDTVDNLFLDPDADTLEDATWIAKKCVHPVWQVAEDYPDVPEGVLRRAATLESATAQAEEQIDSQVDGDDRKGKTNDLITYWKIWSKMGLGDRLKGVKKDYRDTLNEFGDNVFIAIAPNIPYPLNLTSTMFLDAATEPDPEEMLMPQEGPSARDKAFDAVQWPIPFWLDKGSWPFSELSFHELPNCVWPMAHMRPIMPQLKALNYGMSFAMDRSHHASRLFIGVPKSADEELKNQAEDGGPVTVMEISAEQAPSGKIGEVLQFMNANQGGLSDHFQVMQILQDYFDKGSGLTEVAYAMPGGMRTAREAAVKQAAANVRPDDMANKVEDWMTLVARKEAFAAVYILTGQDVQPMLGPLNAQLWDRFIHSESPEIAFELDYRIEAGSARKPNKETRIEQMNQSLQVVAPVLANLVPQGVPGPWNAMIEEWGKANEIQDITRFLVPPPPPPKPPPPDPKVQGQLQLQQAKLQQDAQQHQAKMQEMQIDAQLKQQLAQMQIQIKQMEMRLEAQKAQQELSQDQQQFDQEMGQERQKAALEMGVERRKAQMDMSLAAMMGRTKVEVARQQASIQKKKSNSNGSG